jgi:peptidoglycan/LPS O-acetylase OafA/YrhL
MNESKSNFDDIDVFKGLAILGVVLLHYNSALECPSLLFGKLTAIGARCPQVFFVLSAFLSWKSLDQHQTKTVQYWYRRYIRLFPVYYFALVVCLLLPGYCNGISFRDIVSHFLFLNACSPFFANSVIGIEWYISDLAIFILLTPLIRKYVKTLKRAICFVVLAEIISILFTMITNYIFFSEINNIPRVETWLHTFCIINQIPVLALGILAYYVVVLMKENPQSYRIVFVYACIVCVITLMFMLFHLNKRIITSSFIAGLNFTMIFLIVELCKAFYPKIRNKCFGMKVIKRLLMLFGKRCYGIYCLHVIVIKKICNYFECTNTMTIWIAVFILVLFLSLVLGVFVENLIGNKITNYLKGKGERYIDIVSDTIVGVVTSKVKKQNDKES